MRNKEKHAVEEFLTLQTQSHNVGFAQPSLTLQQILMQNPKEFVTFFSQIKTRENGYQIKWNLKTAKEPYNNTEITKEGTDGKKMNTIKRIAPDKGFWNNVRLNEQFSKRM